MDNVYLLSHSVHSCILPLPLLSVCIVDVLSSDFLYGTALSVLTYTLITQTARNPLLAPLPNQLFSSLFVCVYACVFVRQNVPVYTLELYRDGRRVLLYTQWSRTVWIWVQPCMGACFGSWRRFHSRECSE